MRFACLSAVCLLSICLLTPKVSAEQREAPLPAEYHPTLIQSSASSTASFKSAPGDTFYLYGGPGSLLGKFQTALPIGNPTLQGWVGHDVTDAESFWQPSLFRSPSGTQAMWAGRELSQESGWDSSPGYGNSWNALLVYRKSVSDPTQAQTIDLSFVFHHDVEPGFDFFIVEYDSAGTTLEVLVRTGSTGAVPVHFPSETQNVRPIVFAGNDYGPSQELTIRLRVTSDSVWSDEDGLYDSNGAAQVDEIRVASSEGVDFENFEGPGPYLWLPEKSPFAGLFARVFARVTDLDPCRENETPVLGFIDDGTPASNPGGVLWNGDPIPSLGTTSLNWSYGIPGGWVVNYNGGLSARQLQLDNEVWSPEIVWDLPGSADDGEDVVGAFLRFDVYAHLPYQNGLFYDWEVRGRDASTSVWHGWTNRGFLVDSSTPRWLSLQEDVTRLLPVNCDRVQFLVAVRDLAANFGLLGTDATVAPLYDNAAFAKYRVGGPVLVTREIDLFGDSFASSGLADASTQAARNQLDCRIDMSRSITPANSPIRSGDSLIVDITSVVPAATLVGSTLHYSLNKNPVFEAAIRPNAPTTELGGGLFGWDQSEGTVAATQSVNTAGVPWPDRFYFDLPDDGFLYPGDVLEYYLEAVDSDGRSSTLPADLAGYDDGANGTPYNRVYQIRGLPTYTDGAGSHPDVLFWNDFANRGGDEEILSALRQNGLREGVHFDAYSTRGPSSYVDNGLGSWSPNGRGHGATLAQLSGYRSLLYESGDLTGDLISNGGDVGFNDKGNDVGLLRSWFDAPNQTRCIAHFGDKISSYLASFGYGSSDSQRQYLMNVMGVARIGEDLRPAISSQTAPVVLSSGAATAFTAEFIAFGGCSAINRFDNIAPLTGAVRGHGFEVLGAPGTTYPAPGHAASVVWDRMVGSARKLSVTFPFGMMYVHPVLGEQPSGLPILLGELFDLFEQTSGPPTASDLSRRSLELLAPAPNPFNPRTVLRFTLGRAARGDIEIFDLRGRSVRGLARNVDFDAGPQQLVWDGRDDAGVEIASGVYLARYRIDGFTKQQKLVLLR